MSYEWTNPPRCPVCGHGDGWCGQTVDGCVTRCMRVASDHPSHSPDGGWLHFRDTGNRPTFGGKVFYINSKHGRDDAGDIAEQYRAAAWPAMVETFASSIGVSADSLHRLGVGWAFDQTSRKGIGAAVHDPGDAMRGCACRTWSFPMKDAAGRIVGIRLRRDDAQKYSVAGGCEGLFIPADLSGDTLLIAEGPTDTAALLDLGFSAVGRPSCSGGVQHIVAFQRQRNFRKLMIMSDSDLPGRRGALRLAQSLRLYCRDVRVIEPPAGIKDARAWKIAGATGADVQDAIDAAPMVGIRIVPCAARGVAYV